VSTSAEGVDAAQTGWVILDLVAPVPSALVHLSESQLAAVARAFLLRRRKSNLAQHLLRTLFDLLLVRKFIELVVVKFRS